MQEKLQIKSHNIIFDFRPSINNQKRIKALPLYEYYDFVIDTLYLPNKLNVFICLIYLLAKFSILAQYH